MRETLFFQLSVPVSYTHLGRKAFDGPDKNSRVKYGAGKSKDAGLLWGAKQQLRLRQMFEAGERNDRLGEQISGAGYG